MITTASSTPCSKRLRTEGARAPGLAVGFALWLAALLLLCGIPGLSQAQTGTSRNASVTQLRLEQGDDGVYLTAGVQFELPALVEETLEKGIAIYFVAEAEVYRERWYWTDQKVAQAARHMRLAYQPLTRRWRLNVSPQPISNSGFGFGVSLNQNFESLSDALDAVRRIGRMRLGSLTEVGDDAVHAVNFQFRLDTSQLPRPFQIGVAGQADWNVVAERSAKLPLEKAP